VPLDRLEVGTAHEQVGRSGVVSLWGDGLASNISGDGTAIASPSNPGSTMHPQTLKNVIGRKLDSGTLPTRNPIKLEVRRGTSAMCDACGRRIGAVDIEHEFSYHDGHPFRLHLTARQNGWRCAVNAASIWRPNAGALCSVLLLAIMTATCHNGRGDPVPLSSAR
jgi:hypothetical protein